MLKQIQAHIQAGKLFRIVFVGDSLTSCEWVHPNWREIIEYVLKQELGKSMEDWKLPSWNIRCINSGLDGSTTSDFLTRLDEYVLQFDPQLTFIMLGGNDRFFIDPSDTKGNLLKIIRAVQYSGSTVILSTEPVTASEAYDHDKEGMQKDIRILAQEADYFVDMYEKTKDIPLDRIYTFHEEEGNEECGINPGGIDFVHPNSLGNAYIAQVFLKELFTIDFDPEKYMKDVASGEKYPRY